MKIDARLKIVRAINAGYLPTRYAAKVKSVANYLLAHGYADEAQ